MEGSFFPETIKPAVLDQPTVDSGGVSYMSKNSDQMCGQTSRGRVPGQKAHIQGLLCAPKLICALVCVLVCVLVCAPKLV